MECYLRSIDKAKCHLSDSKNVNKNIMNAQKFVVDRASLENRLMQHVALVYVVGRGFQFCVWFSRFLLLTVWCRLSCGSPNRSSIDDFDTQSSARQLTEKRACFFSPFFPPSSRSLLLKLEQKYEVSVYDRAWRVQDMKLFLSFSSAQLNGVVSFATSLWENKVRKLAETEKWIKRFCENCPAPELQLKKIGENYASILDT